MEKRVLVLNLDHSPAAVVTVQKAIVLLHLEKVTCLSVYEFLEVRTVNRSFDYPAVICLNNYKSIPYRGVLLNIFSAGIKENANTVAVKNNSLWIM
jgi:hypothetical protein